MCSPFLKAPATTTLCLKSHPWRGCLSVLWWNFDRYQCVIHLQSQSKWLLDHPRVLLLRHIWKEMSRLRVIFGLAS